jgi:hypothetical protein
MVTDEFRAAAARIEANPLGRLMYGQRELFHSNLLAWFFDSLPEAADRAFGEYATPGVGNERQVERERGHLDLVMRWPDRLPLVIENKVFSLPQAAQLDEYRQATAKWNPAPSLVLLSTTEPSFDLGEWKHVSYAELAERIRASLPTNASYEVETMRRYADLVGDLHQLVAAVRVKRDDEPIWLGEDVLSAISSSQMRAALQKSRAQRVADVVAKALPGPDGPKASMSNATPLVELFQYAFLGGVHAHFGWQLQGNQFRRAVVYHDAAIKGRDEASRRAREELSRQHPEFFTLPTAISATRSGRKEFNHFAPNFVYQYAKVGGLTVGELISAAQEVHESIVGMEDPAAGH